MRERERERESSAIRTHNTQTQYTSVLDDVVARTRPNACDASALTRVPVGQVAGPRRTEPTSTMADANASTPTAADLEEDKSLADATDDQLVIGCAVLQPNNGDEAASAAFGRA